MQCKMFSIPIDGNAVLAPESKLNEFLGAAKVKLTFASLAGAPANPFWSVLCFFEDGAQMAPARPAVANRTAAPSPAVAPGPTTPNPAAATGPTVQPNILLTGEQVRMIMALKKWRANEAALANVPLYKVAQNRWLEEIVRMPARSLDDLKKVTGMGDWRVQKYGAKILEVLNATSAAKSAWPNSSFSAGQA